MKLNRRLVFVAGSVLALGAIGASQIKQIIKIVGVGAAVKQFGGDINKSLNNLTGHKDTASISTKVVPIISAGINSRQAIGAAQVMGPKRLIDQVEAVAQIDQDILGKEIKIRAMIPVSTAEIKDLSNIKRVEGVGVSGTVDLKL